MASTMNEKLHDENKKVWKIKQVHDEQEEPRGKKVSAVMLSGFVTGPKESVVASVNDSSQDGLLDDKLF